MELINNDEEDNANRNLINNNQNIENNFQIRNNNINNENNEAGNIFISKYSFFTNSFLFIFITNIIFYIYSKYSNIEEYKYVFEFVPIFDKNQYYRIITRYLISKRE